MCAKPHIINSQLLLIWKNTEYFGSDWRLRLEKMWKTARLLDEADANGELEENLTGIIKFGLNDRYENDIIEYSSCCCTLQ